MLEFANSSDVQFFIDGLNPDKPPYKKGVNPRALRKRTAVAEEVSKQRITETQATGTDTIAPEIKKVKLNVNDRAVLKKIFANFISASNDESEH